jgi:hypothetical protein
MGNFYLGSATGGQRSTVQNANTHIAGSSLSPAVGGTSLHVLMTGQGTERVSFLPGVLPSPPVSIVFPVDVVTSRQAQIDSDKE